MDLDTRIGGNRSRFPETRRSAIVNVRSDDAAVRTAAWEVVISAYWKPVYKYIRIRWNRSNEDAKDLTQAFFARAFEKEFFRGYEPARASFRTYLRTCLDGFLANQDQSARRVKRAEGAHPISLDFETAEGELRHQEIAANQQSPDEYFHQEWVRGIFSLAVADLRQESNQHGRSVPFQLFERYDLRPDGENPTYQSLAAEFGISTAAAANYLAAMRRRLRQLVLDRIRASTANQREFRSEARAVLGIEV